MINKIIFVFAIVYMSGCTIVQTGITQNHIDVANKLCEMNGGIKTLARGMEHSKENGHSEISATLTCKNGSEFIFNVIK